MIFYSPFTQYQICNPSNSLLPNQKFDYAPSVAIDIENDVVDDVDVFVEVDVVVDVVVDETFSISHNACNVM